MREALEAEGGRLVQAHKALSEGLAELSRLRAQITKDCESQLLDLAVEIARKVLMQEIQAGRYEIEPIVKEVLRHVPNRQDVVVRLHPEDFAACGPAREAGGQEADAGVRFVADTSVPRAGCVLETPEGNVESAVEDHLDGIAEALKE